MPAPLPERIGHVRIEQLAGEGGMGTVYVGFDERLQRRVAVKMLRPEARLSPDARARLLREARLLSRLDHPGICRIHDLIEAEGTDVLLLEYVEGRSLGSRRRDLPPEEALRIGERLADALAAAHREGIVHRDLKPDNVMITPDGAVKVLDFGIARAVASPPRPASASHPARNAAATTRHFDPSADTAPTAGLAAPVQPAVGADEARTLAGAVVGTLAYMSPEQARGDEVTTASDVFALGLVLQELLTGKWAFEIPRSGDLFEHIRRGHTRPITGVEPELASLVEQMKAPQPEARPAADSVARRLREIRQAPERRRQQRRRLAALAGVVTLVALAATVSWRLARPSPLVEAGQRARVAVLPFRNATGQPELAWVKRGLMQVVAQELAGYDAIDVVPVGEVEAEMDPGDALPEASVRRLERDLGAPVLLEVTLHERAQGWALAYRLHYGAPTPIDDRVEAVDLAVAARLLAGRVAARLVPGTADVESTGRLSRDSYASLTYAIGLGQLDRAGPGAARPYFEVCLERDPGFGWARVALASVLHALASGDRSDALAREALEQARAGGDRRLEAAALRRLGTNLQERGDYAAAQSLLEQALAASRAAGERYEVVETLNNLATNAYRTGELDRAEALYGEVLSGARELGHRKREGAALNNLGGIAYSRSDVDRAASLWSRALEVFRTLDLRNLQAVALGNLAVVASGRGELDRAQAFEEERLAIHRAAGDRLAEAQGLVNLSETLDARGDGECALTRAREGLAAAVDAGDRFTELYARAALVQYLTDAGRLAEAAEHADVALELAAQVQAPDAQVPALCAVGSLRLVQGRRDAARSLLARARSLEPETAAADLLEARLLRATGHSAEALRAYDSARRRASVWGPRQQSEVDALRAAASPAGDPPPGH